MATQNRPWRESRSRPSHDHPFSYEDSPAPKRQRTEFEEQQISSSDISSLKKASGEASESPHEPKKLFSCTLCKKSFTRQTSLRRHVQTARIHTSQRYPLTENTEWEAVRTDFNVKSEILSEPEEDGEMDVEIDSLLTRSKTEDTYTRDKLDAYPEIRPRAKVQESGLQYRYETKNESAKSTLAATEPYRSTENRTAEEVSPLKAECLGKSERFSTTTPIPVKSELGTTKEDLPVGKAYHELVSLVDHSAQACPQDNELVSLRERVAYLESMLARKEFGATVKVEESPILRCNAAKCTEIFSSIDAWGIHIASCPLLVDLEAPKYKFMKKNSLMCSFMACSAAHWQSFTSFAELATHHREHYSSPQESSKYYFSSSETTIGDSKKDYSTIVDSGIVITKQFGSYDDFDYHLGYGYNVNVKGGFEYSDVYAPKREASVYGNDGFSKLRRVAIDEQTPSDYASPVIKSEVGIVEEASPLDSCVSQPSSSTELSATSSSSSTSDTNLAPPTQMTILSSINENSARNNSRIQNAQPRSVSKKRRATTRDFLIPGSKIAEYWEKVLTPWVVVNFERILGDDNPGAVEVAKLHEKPVVFITAADVAKVDRFVLKNKIAQSEFSFKIRVLRGNVSRSGSNAGDGDSEDSSESESDEQNLSSSFFPPLNGGFEKMPSCGASIGVMGSKEAVSGTLGGYIELKEGAEWKTYAVTSHHLLEDWTETTQERCGVRNGTLGDQTFLIQQPSNAHLRLAQTIHQFGEETQDNELRGDPDLAESASGSQKEYKKEIESSITEKYYFGKVKASSGYGTKVPGGPQLDWALIGDVVPSRDSNGTRLCTSESSFQVFGRQLLGDLTKEMFEEMLQQPTTLLSKRIHGIGATTGHQDGYLRPQTGVMKAEKFGTASSEYCFTPRFEEGLGQKGDSGAWVFDSLGFAVGMILARNNARNITYFTPIYCLLEDIKESLAARAIKIAIAKPNSVCSADNAPQRQKRPRETHKNPAVSTPTALISLQDLFQKHTGIRGVRLGNSFTALHAAAADGNIENAQLLLRACNDVNVLDNLGRTPLHYASNKMVSLLLNNGADVSVTDDKKMTPLHCAVQRPGNREGVEALLLKAFAEVLVNDSQGKYPLHYAAASGDPELVDLLLVFHQKSQSHLLRIRFEDNKRCTPLHHAPAGGSLEITMRLVSFGFSVYDLDLEGCSPLHHAAGHGAVEIVNFLLGEYEDFDITEVDFNGRSPLFHAFSKGCMRTIKLLQDHGNRATSSRRARRARDLYS